MALGEHSRLWDWRTAMGEALSNSCLHGASTVEVQCWAEGGLVFWEVEDNGEGYSVELKVKAAERAASDDVLSLMKEHGRGILLMKELCDVWQAYSGSYGTITRGAVRVA